MVPQVVFDTNVLYSAINSRLGASYLLLQHVGLGLFDLHLSTPLALQYEDVLKRDLNRVGVDEATIDDILDYVSATSKHHSIYYLWRPFLPDFGDDLILELAFAARCSVIITHNLRHFRGIEGTFGIKPMTPLQFLKVLGVRK
jgi:predicted nucleic acid-binding protein